MDFRRRQGGIHVGGGLQNRTATHNYIDRPVAVIYVTFEILKGHGIEIRHPFSSLEKEERLCRLLEISDEASMIAGS